MKNDKGQEAKRLIPVIIILEARDRPTPAVRLVGQQRNGSGEMGKGALKV